MENFSTSGLLDRLEKGAYIERRPDPDDRRGVLIFLPSSDISARAQIKASVKEMGRKLQRKR
ncbi:MAG: MarR family transcriptional regulator [Firmicutes bacterium]|nr:MarR family transcriptional regulator [Bacillota bacterium]